MEAALDFIKNEKGVFEAEFTATSLVGVHIERPQVGGLYIEHRLSADGQYFCDRSYGINGPLLFDAWLESDGYAEGIPVHWRIRSKVEPSVAVLISKG